MSTKILEYSIYPKYKLIIEKFAGNCTSKDFIELKTKEFNDLNFNKDYNYIVDIRDTELQADIKGLEEFLIFMKESEQMVNNNKYAFIVRKPLQIAIITLFKKKTKKLPIMNNIFTSLNKVTNFLELEDINPTKIENLINTLVPE